LLHGDGRDDKAGQVQVKAQSFCRLASDWLSAEDGFVRQLLSIALALLALGKLDPALAQTFTVQGPGVNSNDFRITTFTSGLTFPLGMTTLPDGSLLVGLAQGSSYFAALGKLVRFTDTNNDGVADGPGTLLYTGLSGGVTDVRAVSNLVFTSGPGKPMSIFRMGATPSDQLTLLGQLILNYPNPGWEHMNSGLSVRTTPGWSNRYDVVFQVGSESNFAATTKSVTLTNANISGANAALAGDSLYMITLIDQGATVSATNLIQIANGLRNPAGAAFHPTTGDLYFEDNGIDGLVNADNAFSADELNLIARTNLDGPVEFFGFPNNYTVYPSGALAGGAGIQPLISFLPVNGSKSEGPNNVCFAPPGFPPGLNTGILVGFHGSYSSAGTNNQENPLVYANPATGAYFHFIKGQQAGIGHLDGLLATGDSLFVADLATTGNIGSGSGAGVIYQIKSLVSTPPVLSMNAGGSTLILSWDRGRLQQADSAAGPWSDVPDAFSPQTISMTGSSRFFRAAY
jgi:glucose/arabinose dehydrogenase